MEYLKLTTEEPGVLDANSRSSGPDRSMIVTGGFKKPLRIEDPLAPPLEPIGKPEPGLRLRQGRELRTGDRERLRDDVSPQLRRVERAGARHGGVGKTSSDQYGVGDLPPDTTMPVPPPMCVAVETGDKIGQFRQGLSQRFETPTCWPNNWPQDQAPPGRAPEDEAAIDAFFAPGGYDFANDPRYVTFIITDSTAFQGSGNDQVPIKYFAGFYDAGWDVTGNVKPCLDNDPHPWYGTTYRKSLDNGDVWGHFVNLVLFASNGSGSGSEELCNFDGIGNCIAVLVE